MVARDLGKRILSRTSTPPQHQGAKPAKRAYCQSPNAPTDFAYSAPSYGLGKISSIWTGMMGTFPRIVFGPLRGFPSSGPRPRIGSMARIPVAISPADDRISDHCLHHVATSVRPLFPKAAAGPATEMGGAPRRPFRFSDVVYRQHGCTRGCHERIPGYRGVKSILHP